MKKIKKMISIILILAVCFSFTGCENELAERIGSDYKYEKQSEKMLNFSSSDSKLDAFLNDYFHRHLRYDDYRIGELSLGGSVMFNKEWEAMSLFWFDCTGETVPDDRVKMMERFLNDIPVDKFGYTWQAFDSLLPSTCEPNVYFGQGWPFPDYSQSAGMSEGFEFNPNSSNTSGWLANNITSKGKESLDYSVDNGLLTVRPKKSKVFEIISPELNIDTFHSPFLELDVRLFDGDNIGVNSNIEDLYIYFKTEGDEDWSEERCVSQKEFATLPTTVSASWSKRLYFPMNLCPTWGTDKIVNQIKIVLKSKEGKEFNGKLDMSYLRGNYDTRHSNNAELLLRSARMHYEYTGKVDILARNLNRYRQSAQFLLSHLKGKDGLMNFDYFTGHDGVNGLGHGIGNGYWDISSSAPTSLYANIYFYKALKSMAYLENVAEKLELNISKPTVTNKDCTGKIPYVETSTTLNELAEQVKLNIQKDITNGGFWDSVNGRFIEGFNAIGEKMDYGYINFNLEVVAEDLATKEQAKQIMSWINGDRIIESDLNAGGQNYASGKKGSAVKDNGKIDFDGTLGIYDFEFAPRATTVKNYNHYVWSWGGTNRFGEQVQDGGAVMFLSYYDIMARMKTFGVDDAFSRLKGIEAWYSKVQKEAKRLGVGTDLNNNQFYRVYYDMLEMQMQGDNTAGGIGLDAEFLESALLYAVVPNVFFGLKSEVLNTLQIEPKLPSSLKYWKMENLVYQSLKYDLTIGDSFAQIDYVRGNSRNLNLEITLKKPNKKFSVYCNDSKLSSNNYKVIGDKVIVTVPFRQQKIYIK